MKITEKDIGRRVKLRNHRIVTIKNTQGDYFTTEPNLVYAYNEKGEYLGFNNPSFDMIEFVDDQPTHYVSIHDIF